MLFVYEPYTFAFNYVFGNLKNCEIDHGHFCLTTCDATLMKYIRYVNPMKMFMNVKLVINIIILYYLFSHSYNCG